MKKITLYLMTLGLSFIFCPQQSNALNTVASSSITAPKPNEQAEAKALLRRLDEINAMDKSNLSASDKNNLQKEVRSIRYQLKHISGGIYISFGAIIIIIILLIILL